MKAIRFDWVPICGLDGDYERADDGFLPFMWLCGEGVHKAFPETKGATTIWVKVFRRQPKWHSGVIVRDFDRWWLYDKHNEEYLSITISDGIKKMFRGVDKVYFQLWHNVTH